MLSPSLILHSGKIYTVDEAQPWAEAIAISGRIIAAVGRDEQIMPMAGEDTLLLNLEGRLVLPGLCDAHIHLHEWSLGQKQLDLTGVPSKAAMLEAVGEWAEKQGPDSWIIGRGWNETSWPTDVMPSRQELDEVSGARQPVILWRSDMHCALANSRTLEVSEIDRNKPDPDGGVIGRDSDGKPDGRLFELAINLVTPLIPQPEPAELREIYLQGIETLHSLGVTAAHSQRMKDQREGPLSFSTLLDLRENKVLKLRINHNIAAHDVDHLGALGLHSGFGDDYLRLGHVKLFADGTLGSKTAWMLEPLESTISNDPNAYGICLTEPSEMASVVEAACLLGFPVSIHAIGDRANREVLDIFEEISRIVPAPKVAHRIEHVQIIDPVDIARLKSLNVSASVQPVHALDDMDIADELLQERSARAYNFGSLVRSEALVALGSDAPVADPNPFIGFHAAIFRQRPERMSEPSWYADQRISLEETIYGYSLGAAIAGGWQDTIGSITPGKRADVIVLDRDLFGLTDPERTPRAIAGTKVVWTLFDGEIVYESRDIG